MTTKQRRELDGWAPAINRWLEETGTWHRMARYGNAWGPACGAKVVVGSLIEAQPRQGGHKCGRCVLIETPRPRPKEPALARQGDGPHVFTVTSAQLAACPTGSLLPSHYRDDGTCLHTSPTNPTKGR